MPRENLNNYEILAEYPTYYLAKSQAGYKECFPKTDKKIKYEIIDEKVIVKKSQKDFEKD